MARWEVAALYRERDYDHRVPVPLRILWSCRLALGLIMLGEAQDGARRLWWTVGPVRRVQERRR